MTAPAIDLYDPDNYVVDLPWEQIHWLQKNAPVYEHPHPMGGHFWVLTKHADVLAASKNHELFSSSKGFVMIDDLSPQILSETRFQLVGMDPPHHGPIRRLVAECFTSRNMARIETRIRQIVRNIFEAAPAEANFVDAYAGLLPTASICELMGIPEEMWLQVRSWADLNTSEAPPEQILAASHALGAYGYELASSRVGKGGSDMISLLMNLNVEGQRIDEQQFSSLFVQITAAGNETTRTLISGGMHELIKSPAIYDHLASNIGALPRAIEEMLRWTTPLHHFRRTATRDTLIRGKKIKEGDRVLMMYSAANFDPDVFADPFRFDIDRHPNPHLGFGYGIHLCVGANLARLQTRIFFEEFFRLFERIEQKGPAARFRSNLVNGLKVLPVQVHRRK